ncbi:hypothetical protein [Halomarina litorea]|uniref:hypothetical protein n=1 Tax=Halomarina litorea TaxID=2961595 RepID=UPI0020C31D7F|nr:hypothetical protein [Halomarina sp. BCD28]
MSLHQLSSDRFCPACGTELPSAGGKSIGVADDIGVSGRFPGEGGEACIVVDDGQIRVYQHGEADR